MNHWRRPGLAGGIDHDGSRAAELLGTGFGSVEFGTVCRYPEPGRPGVGALVRRLAALAPDVRRGARIGVGIGLGPGAPPAALAGHWLAGMQAAWPVADYLCFNLSATANRRLLEPGNETLLADALTMLTIERARIEAVRGRRVELALKLPLAARQMTAPARIALTVGFDALIVVLPDTPERFDRLAAWARGAGHRAALVAVGGIRDGADVRNALRAGASGIQVHRLFTEQGGACLAPLLAGFGQDS